MTLPRQFYIKDNSGNIVIDYNGSPNYNTIFGNNSSDLNAQFVLETISGITNIQPRYLGDNSITLDAFFTSRHHATNTLQKVSVGQFYKFEYHLENGQVWNKPVILQHFTAVGEHTGFYQYQFQWYDVYGYWQADEQTAVVPIQSLTHRDSGTRGFSLSTPLSTGKYDAFITFKAIANKAVYVWGTNDHLYVAEMSTGTPGFPVIAWGDIQNNDMGLQWYDTVTGQYETYPFNNVGSVWVDYSNGLTAQTYTISTMDVSVPTYSSPSLPLCWGWNSIRNDGTFNNVTQVWDATAKSTQYTTTYLMSAGNMIAQSTFTIPAGVRGQLDLGSGALSGIPSIQWYSAQGLPIQFPAGGFDSILVEESPAWNDGTVYMDALGEQYTDITTTLMSQQVHSATTFNTPPAEFNPSLVTYGYYINVSDHFSGDTFFGWVNNNSASTNLGNVPPNTAVRVADGTTDSWIRGGTSFKIDRSFMLNNISWSARTYVRSSSQFSGSPNVLQRSYDLNSTTPNNGIFRMQIVNPTNSTVEVVVNTYSNTGAMNNNGTPLQYAVILLGANASTNVWFDSGYIDASAVWYDFATDLPVAFNPNIQSVSLEDTLVVATQVTTSTVGEVVIPISPIGNLSWDIAKAVPLTYPQKTGAGEIFISDTTGGLWNRVRLYADNDTQTFMQQAWIPISAGTIDLATGTVNGSPWTWYDNDWNIVSYSSGAQSAIMFGWVHTTGEFRVPWADRERYIG